MGGWWEDGGRVVEAGGSDIGVGWEGIGGYKKGEVKLSDHSNLFWYGINSMFCILAVYITHFEYLQVHLIGSLYLRVKFGVASIHRIFRILARTSLAICTWNW